MRPQDVMPDHENEIALGDCVVRKGTVAAFIANALVLTEPTAPAEARRRAEEDLRALVPALRALRIFEVLAIRDSAIRRLVEETP
jgi:hypothetical protein